MDNKFYVSLEAARLLKEKGYRERYHAYYFGDSNLRKGGYRGDSWYDSPDFYPAPTKSEVIDWLESKGLVIVVFRRTINNEVGWRYVIYNQTEIISGFKTRLEAEEAAIIKALELLKIRTNDFS